MCSSDLQIEPAFSKANAAFLKANSAYESQNTTGTYANAAFLQSNAAFNKANTSIQTSGINSITSGSLTITNTGGVGLTVTGNAVFNNDITVSGNVYIGGNATTFSANNITLDDSLIYLADSNPANTVDIGIVGHFVQGTYQHTGIVRDHTDGTWKFFSNVITEPSTTVNFTGAVYDSVKMGDLTATTATVGGTNLLPYTQAAFLKANTATSDAGGASLYANGAFIQANAAFGIANTATSNALAASTYANGAFIQANTATNNAAGASLYANGAFVQANAAYGSQNTTGSYANSAYTQANTATNNAAGASLYANGAFIQANAAFLKANGAVQSGFTTYAANGTNVTPSSNADTLNITSAVANGINVLDRKSTRLNSSHT